MSYKLLFQRINSLLVGIIILSVLLFSEWVQKKGYFVFPAGIRQILVLLYFIYLWFTTNYRIEISKIYVFYLLLLLIFLFINFFMVDVKIINYLAGILFTFNFVFVFLFSSSSQLDELVIVNFLKGIFYLIFVFVLPPFLEGILEGTSLRYHPGVFREAGALGTIINCGVIISLCLFIIKKNSFYLYSAIFFTLIVFFTTLKKAIVCDSRNFLNL